MAYPRATVRQADVTRAAKAVRAAGLEIERVEITSEGKIVVFPRGASGDGGPNPCDRLLR